MISYVGHHTDSITVNKNTNHAPHPLMISTIETKKELTAQWSTRIKWLLESHSENQLKVHNEEGFKPQPFTRHSYCCRKTQELTLNKDNSENTQMHRHSNKLKRFYHLVKLQTAMGFYEDRQDQQNYVFAYTIISTTSKT